MDKRRITDFVDICPVCGRECRVFSSKGECEECGYPMGKDWETVEMDLESRVILRTIIPAQPKTGVA